MSKILVINAGSSTIKWKVFAQNNLTIIAEGVADRIGIDGVLETKFNGQKHKVEKLLKDHVKGMDALLEQMQSLKIISYISEITSIGHRVVHGGEEFSQSVILNEQNIKKIADLSVLAPLHNPNAVNVIKACLEIFGKDIFQTATFDTSFHTTIPPVNSTYPINANLAEELKIKKYGFHGTSHRYITNKLKEILNKDSVTFINAHIGNGASICAIKDNKSFDTTMGLTPLSGVMMGTRSGDIDPSIIKFIMDNKKISIDEVDAILNKESGMKGVSKISPDMRDILAAIDKNDSQAIFAYKLYVQSAVDVIAKYANKLEHKIDALVFTAGIGENDSYFRKSVVKKLTFDKISIDLKKNKIISDEFRKISNDDSNLDIFVVPTDEELLIAQDNKELKK